MKDLPEHMNGRDDVDHLIDQLMADPSAAEQVKKILRHKIASPDVVAVAPRPITPKETDVAVDEDVEDMWDNVPI